MGIWNELAVELRQRTLRDGEVTMTIEEIIRRTGTTDKSVREPGWWDQAARGTEAYRAFADESVALAYEQQSGKVTRVSFWHALFPPSSRDAE